jgi:hypothetical protein
MAVCSSEAVGLQLQMAVGPLRRWRRLSQMVRRAQLVHSSKALDRGKSRESARVMHTLQRMRVASQVPMQ